MKDKVVLVTEKKAEKARKMIEAKGMRVDEQIFKVSERYKYIRFDSADKDWFVSIKKSNETELPWKEFKAMFRKKKKSKWIAGSVDIVIVGSPITLKEAIDLTKISAKDLENTTEHPTEPKELSEFEKLDPIIQDLMLFEQVRQGNEKNAEVFIYDESNSLSIIEAYKEKTSEFPELMEIFKKHGYFQEKEIDWSKPLQVVESDSTLILTNGQHNGSSFGGMKIQSKHNEPVQPIGWFSEKWAKHHFKLCEDQNLDFLKENNEKTAI